MPRAKKVTKKVILSIEETKPEKVKILSTKAYVLFDKLNTEFCKIDNSEDAEYDYARAVENLEEAKAELQNSIDEANGSKKLVEDSQKAVEKAFQDVIKSRMNIKSLSLQLAALIDEMEKPLKKKRKKRVKKVVVQEEQFVQIGRQI